MNRQESALYAKKAIQTINNADYAVMVEGGNAYALKGSDIVINAPDSSSQFDIVGESIPFYQIALHSYLELSGAPVNLSDTPVNLLLWAAETGSTLHFYLGSSDKEILIGTKYDELYSVDYEIWKKTLINYVSRLTKLNSQTYNQPIIKHKRIQKDIYETTFENGIKVIVNYMDTDIEVEGRSISAKDFVVIEEVAE